VLFLLVQISTLIIELYKPYQLHQIDLVPCSLLSKFNVITLFIHIMLFSEINLQICDNATYHGYILQLINWKQIIYNTLFSSSKINSDDNKFKTGNPGLSKLERKYSRPII
jgi:hypothetical protein